MSEIQTNNSVFVPISELKEYSQKELPYFYFDLLFFMELCPDYFGRPVDKIIHDLNTGMVEVFFKQFPPTHFN